MVPVAGWRTNRCRNKSTFITPVKTHHMILERNGACEWFESTGLSNIRSMDPSDGVGTRPAPVIKCTNHGQTLHCYATADRGSGNSARWLRAGSRHAPERSESRIRSPALLLTYLKSALCNNEAHGVVRFGAQEFAARSPIGNILDAPLVARRGFAVGAVVLVRSGTRGDLMIPNGGSQCGGALASTLFA